MGRWVTSKGRRIYIPDPGEENPFNKVDKRDALGGNKADREYKAVLRKHVEAGTRMSTPEELADKVRSNIEKRRQLYGKMSVKDMKALDLSKMSYEDKKLLRAELSSRAFTSERGAKALSDKVWESMKADKDADEKERQIARNKAEADERNGGTNKSSTLPKKKEITDAKNHSTLVAKLQKAGYTLESADAHQMSSNPKYINGDKVTLYDDNKNEYEGTFNLYSDGSREIIYIKKK